jgi:hypothetical protein
LIYRGPGKPTCNCHGEPMRRRSRDEWRCAVKMREAQVRIRADNPDPYRARDHRYNCTTQGWVRHRKWQLKGEREVIKARLAELEQEVETCRTSLVKAIQTKSSEREPST